MEVVLLVRDHVGGCRMRDAELSSALRVDMMRQRWTQLGALRHLLECSFFVLVLFLDRRAGLWGEEGGGWGSCSSLQLFLFVDHNTCKQKLMNQKRVKKGQRAISMLE